LFVAAVLVVATGLVLFTALIHHGSHKRSEVLVALRELEAEAMELKAAQTEAVDAGEITSQNAAILAQERRDARVVLDELQEAHLPPAEYERIEELYGEFAATGSQITGLVEAGRIEEARALSRGRGGVAYEAFESYADRRLDASEEAAQRAEFLGAVGTYGGGLIAASLLIAIFLRYDSVSRRSRRTLEASEQRHRSLFEQNPDGVYSLDPMGRVLASNPSMTRLLGYTEEEFAGRSAVRLIAADQRRKSAEKFSLALSGVPQNYETALVGKDGSRIEIAMTQVPIIVGGEVTGVYGIAKDITQRLQAEQELRRAENRYRSLVEQMPAAIYIDDVNETNSAVYRSPHVEKVLGYGPEEYLTDPELWQKLLHPEDRERVLAENERTNATGEPFRIEYRQIAKDGSVVWIRDEAVLIRGDDGSPLYWQGVFMDVSERKKSQERLEEAEARYRSLVEQVPVSIYRQDVDHGGAISYISPQIERITGYAAEEYMGDPDHWVETIHPEDRERVLEEDERTDRTGEPFRAEFRKYTRDGRVIWLRDEAVLVRSPTGKPLYWQGIVMDVTERKEAEERLLEAEARYRTLVEQVPAVTYVQELRHSHTVVYVSPQIEEMTGYRPEAFMADPDLWYAVVHPDDLEWVRAEDDRTDEVQEVFRAEYRMVHRNGKVVWVRDEAVLIEDPVGVPRLWQGIMTDITERKNLEQRLRHQALHDPLTGLPNRTLFADRLAQAVARSNRRSENLAVLFVDLDNFKVINDSLGHEVGDNLLVAVAARIKSCLRPADTLARLGGDEFTILLEDVSDVRDATAVVRRVESGLRAPFGVDGREVFVTASIGIALSRTSHPARPADLLRQADLAMYGAKDEGKNSHKVFEEAMNASVNRRLQMENDLRRAVDRDEFHIVYQPKVSLSRGRIIGFEVLVRWQHPERGVIHPSEFITLAEETGLVVPIGTGVLRRACAMARRWRDLPRNGYAPPSISVNLSPRQFLEPDLAATVTRALVDSGLEPEALELEITETVLAQDALRAREVLVRLRNLGVRISIDDFGTGYSSLARLRDLPVDALKIDKSFVAGLGDDRGNEVLVSGMIELAAGLGLDVSAEGVENARQADLLRALGCDCAQGYYFGEPVVGEATYDLLLPAPERPGENLPAGTAELSVEGDYREH
jgi:diguanylate cyclase (GGDEF)-like protein/PAS domain S-box-containing protein